MRIILGTSLLLLMAGSIMGQLPVSPVETDSSAVVDTTAKADDTQAADSVQIDTLPTLLIEPCENCPSSDTTLVDSSAQSAWAAARMDEYRQQVADSVRAVRPVSFFDTLTTYFLSERLNQRSWLDMSWFHDAGDYFRSNPDYFVTDYQSTPMRKTVQPFGLAGDRTNVLIRDHSVRPFDHPLEPDGLFDYNDFATALDDEVYLLSGPAGMIFGGERSVASLLTLPGTPESYAPETELRVDKGSFGLSYIRAGIKKKFVGPRRVDFSLGYRRAAGPTSTRYEDAYHYTGDFVFPLKNRYQVRVWGRLYNRNSPATVRPDSGGYFALRDRFDRDLQVSLSRANARNDQLSQITLTDLSQASRWFGRYSVGYENSARGLKLDHQWRRRELLLKAEFSGEIQKYETGVIEQTRTRTGVSLRAIRTQGNYKLSGIVGANYVEGVRLLPSAALLAVRESERWFLMASLGYSERAPTLHELYLPLDSATIMGISLYDYSNRGNPDLLPEKELTANVTLEYGSLNSALRLSVTGGKIADGISWRPVDIGRREEYVPSNGDVEFVGLSLTHHQKLFGHFDLRGGGSYHYQKREDINPIPYAPKYQLFGGGEFHLYWPQRLLHLFAYAEVVYASGYEGYVDDNLGRVPLVNVTLSFKMRSFRFHWVMKNALSFWDSPRDYHQGIPQFTYYGFTWDFLD